MSMITIFRSKNPGEEQILVTVQAGSDPKKLSFRVEKSALLAQILFAVKRNRTWKHLSMCIALIFTSVIPSLVISLARKRLLPHITAKCWSLERGRAFVKVSYLIPNFCCILKFYEVTAFTWNDLGCCFLLDLMRSCLLGCGMISDDEDARFSATTAV